MTRCRYCRKQPNAAKLEQRRICDYTARCVLEKYRQKSQHICKSIASFRYCLDDVPGSPTLSVTISIGVSCLQKGDTVAAVTQRVDKVLYGAKRSCKNCAFSEKEVA